MYNSAMFSVILCILPYTAMFSVIVQTLSNTAMLSVIVQTFANTAMLSVILHPNPLLQTLRPNERQYKCMGMLKIPK